MRVRPTAVVVGLHVTALGVIRSLAKEGVPIWALGAHPGSPSASTRLCARKIQCNVNRAEELVSKLEQLGRALTRPGVLVTCGDADTLIVSEHREKLAPFYRFVLPEHSVLKTLIDKTAFHDFAARHDIPIPATRMVGSLDEAESLAAKVRFPCLLKPPRNTPAWSSITNGDKVLWAHSAAELTAAYQQVARVEPRLLVQEWIDGPDANVHFVLTYFDRESKPLVHFAGRKLRQWRPLLGSTACAEPYPNEGLVQRTLELFRQWRFCGLGSIEWKRDARTGEFRITEPTAGRCNLQSPVALAWDVNIPYVAYCDAAGLPLPAVQPRARRARYVHEERDLRSGFYYRKRGELSLWQWLGSLRGKRVWAYFSVVDPLPSVLFWQSLVRQGWRKLWGTVFHRGGSVAIDVCE